MLSMKLAACRAFGVWNFEVATRFRKICASLGKSLGIQVRCGIKHLLTHVLSSAVKVEAVS